MVREAITSCWLPSSLQVLCLSSCQLRFFFLYLFLFAELSLFNLALQEAEFSGAAGGCLTSGVGVTGFDLIGTQQNITFPC